ncbi:MAG: class I SAM-dependent methyltransferase [Rhodobacteraceae bacterium]|nr:class I SAM-dependent methyltransferase [Paracoccaceae bacterium]
MPDRETIRVYDGRADAYAELTGAHNAADPRLGAFIAACPPAGRVLDLGCGPGASAAAMADAGLRVEATDASAEMAARAGRHRGVDARQATFDDISGQAVYDGIWANFSLLHAPRADFPRHLAALHRALKPGGAFMIAMKLGRGEARDGIGRFYCYYTAEDLAAHLARAGFTVTGRAFGSGPGLDGSVSDWVSVSARA